MKISATKILIFLVAVSIGMGAWYATQKRPLSVEIASVEKDVDIEVFGLGSVEARVLSTIGFKVSNPIALINVDEGDSVSKGDILAKLDDTEQRVRVTKADAGVQAAKAALEGAKLSVLKTDTVLAQKKRSNDRTQVLYENGTIPADTAEAAQLEKDIAEGDLAIAKSLQLSALSALKTAHAQLALEKVLLEQHTLLAPYAGVIINRHMELGTIVKSGEPLFTLVDPKSVWVLSHISESRSDLIAIGQTAKIQLRSRPHSLYSGEIKRIDVESDRVTEERRVYVSCEECLDNFNLGEQAEVYVTTAVLKEAILVPENAVDNFDERQMKGTVWILEDAKLKRKDVTFGHRTLDARLSISQGIKEGEKVLIRLPQTLQEGRSAKISQGDKP